jgi:hypothetical protein
VSGQTLGNRPLLDAIGRARLDLGPMKQGRERFAGSCPRIISDNGPQFIANDFRHFVKICGMTHVRTSPFYSHSNGRIKRHHRTIKSQCIRPSTPRKAAQQPPGPDGSSSVSLQDRALLGSNSSA